MYIYICVTYALEVLFFFSILKSLPVAGGIPRRKQAAVKHNRMARRSNPLYQRIRGLVRPAGPQGRRPLKPQPDTYDEFCYHTANARQRNCTIDQHVHTHTCCRIGLVLTTTVLQAPSFDGASAVAQCPAAPRHEGGHAPHRRSPVSFAGG